MPLRTFSKFARKFRRPKQSRQSGTNTIHDDNLRTLSTETLRRSARPCWAMEGIIHSKSEHDKNNTHLQWMTLYVAQNWKCKDFRVQQHANENIIAMLDTSLIMKRHLNRFPLEPHACSLDDYRVRLAWAGLYTPTPYTTVRV